MLHELLLALLGFTGDLIVDEREQRETQGLAFDSDSLFTDECTFKVAPDIPLSNPAKAPCRDLLATVTQGLNKFFVLFPPLYEVVLEIERDDFRGGQLLNVLNKRCHCGVPELRTCLQRLLWHGHQVMFNQLAAWMVYGILQDPHGEFFIKRQEDGDLDHRSSQEEISEKLARTSVHETSLTDWHSGFHISLDMLPDYIPMRLGESILSFKQYFNLSFECLHISVTYERNTDISDDKFEEGMFNLVQLI